MKTESLWGFELNTGDHLVIDGEPVGVVTGYTDDGNVLLFEVKDDDGEKTEYPFGPFDAVTIVASYDDDTDEEDVFIDV